MESSCQIVKTNIKKKKKTDIKFIVKHIGDPFVTNSKPAYFEKRYRENMDI